MREEVNRFGITMFERDITTESGQSEAKMYKIKTAPALIVLDSFNKEIDRWVEDFTTFFHYVQYGETFLEYILRR